MARLSRVLVAAILVLGITVTVTATNSAGTANATSAAVDPLTGASTGPCNTLAGGFGDSFDTHYNAPGGLNPSLCGKVSGTKPGDTPRNQGTWTDNTSTYSGVPTDCFEQGTPPTPGAGPGAVRVHANAGNGTSVAQDCIWMGSWRYIAYPSDAYYGLMWYFPTGYTDPSAGQNDEFSEFNWHPYIYSGPMGYSLFGDTLQWYNNTGAWRRCVGCLAQYNNGARAENGGPGANMGPVSNWRIIPKGDLVRNQWIETIVHVHYANNTTGAVQSWYRLKGQTTWNETINQSGFPTIDWGPDSSQNFTWTPNNENGVTTTDHLGLYRTNDTNVPNTTFWIDNYQRQPTFNAVASTMP